ncbi:MULTISPECIES: hypothetical protein [unclassified Lebetimonas]|uniref:hypothetical protein n=1 Tax=unclassified Lebetimonas TaxID=2648158 RepID=UPI000463EF90|nr:MULTISPECIES: hypothetical protein [unclassified Lebetimonas]
MKKILFLSSVAVLSFAYNSSVVMPYGNYINYSGSTSKDKAKLGGIYYSYYKWPVKFEIDGEYLNIDYKNNIPDWLQKDLTLKINFYYKSNWLFNAGVHNFWVKQYDKYHYNKVLFGGIDYYKYLQYNIGVDYYFSDYKDFNVKQITPKVGFNFGNYYSNIGSFYVEGKYNNIHISKDGIAPKKNYNNFDLKLQNFKGPWTTTLKTTFGKFAYKIANDGFVVYNTGDEYKNGYGIDINYNFKKVNNIKVSFERDKFDDNGDSYSNIYVLSYSRAF